MQKLKFISSLGFFNAAIFLLVMLFLPRNGGFGYSGPVPYFINSRHDWHVAFGVLTSTLLISCGVYLLISCFQKKPPRDA